MNARKLLFAPVENALTMRNLTGGVTGGARGKAEMPNEYPTKVGVLEGVSSLPERKKQPPFCQAPNLPHDVAGSLDSTPLVSQVDGISRHLWRFAMFIL